MKRYITALAMSDDGEHYAGANDGTCWLNGKNGVWVECDPLPQPEEDEPTVALEYPSSTMVDSFGILYPAGDSSPLLPPDFKMPGNILPDKRYRMTIQLHEIEDDE